ncbi:MAG: magnesium transporter CorA family protein [Treponema sp.]|nr:magnesium transporter CorA family protein [Treponema sp.]MCR5620793.1 magnesium transporter CorA family protein [Treponema sp.]
MITYWQQEKGRFVEKEAEELAPDSVTWVDARSVTSDDVEILETKYHVDTESILDILDPDELSRIEYIDYNEDSKYILTILRLPVFNPNNDISYFCAPLGIITFGKVVITICWTDCEVLRDFSANRVKELNITDIPAFIIRILARGDLTFLRYLKELNRRATTIQNEMFRTVENEEFLQLLNIQKSLVYFETALKSNQLLLEKLKKTRILKFDEDDRDWLDDVDVDNRQAMEMADTYTNIMAQMMDACASLISNNLSIVMKRMTIISIVITIPTFVTSFFGMNIPLPWGSSGFLGMIFTGAICLVSALVGWYVIMKTSKYAKPLVAHRRWLRGRKKKRK